jgi:hypothetical protein
MKFTVVWRQHALDALADLWKNAVAAASDRIDDLLSRDPLNQGESRPGNYRLLFEGPLGVCYRVNAATSRVVVLSVGPARP